MSTATAAAAAPTAPSAASASGSLNAPAAPPSSPAPSAQPSGTPATSAAPAAPHAPSGDWLSTLPDDAKGYVQNKGFKTPADVLDSYRQLEKTFGVPQDRLLKLPEDMNTPEGRAIRERLGAPKEAKDYGLERLIPKENGDPKLAEWASGVFHEIGVPVKDAEKIIGKWNERAQAAYAASKENFEAMINQGDAALKKEWGAAFDQNIQLAKQGRNALELNDQEVDGLERMIGRERLFKKLRAIGAGVGEASYVAGRPAADGVMAPEQARQKIREMSMDPVWTKRFVSGDSEAKAQMEKWQRMAHPGELTV